MKWSFASVAVVVAGIIGITIILLFQQITTNNESDYYLLKEATEASMIESIDMSYYRETGNLKIIREKFVENFIRRFAESTRLTGTGYTISFYDIMETPPKVSIVINTGLGQYRIFEDTSDYNVQNKLDAILEYVSTNKDIKNSSYPYNIDNNGKSKTLSKEYYYISDNSGEHKLSIRTPDELDAPNIKNVKIESVSKIDEKVSKETFYKELLSQELYYRNVTINDYNIDKLDNGKITSTEFCNSLEKKCYSSSKDDKYWVKLNVDKKSIVKFNVKWSYDEYKFTD